MRLIICSILFLKLTGIYGQITFQKSFASTQTEGIVAVRSTSDGNFICAGNSNGFGTPGTFIIKTNTIGDTIWSKVFWSTSWIGCGDIEETTDHGFILTGYYYNNSKDLLFIKTDSVGNLQWTRTFGNNWDEECKSIKQTHDGGFIATGDRINNTVGQMNVILLKLDYNGFVQWQKEFSFSGKTVGNSIAITSDKGFVVTGWIDTLGNGAGNVFLLKTDSTGVLLWDKAIGGGNGDQGYSVKQTYDDNIIIGGTTFELVGPNSAIDHAYLVKTDNLGNLLWGKMFSSGANDDGDEVIETTDHHYVLAGTTTGFVGNNLYTANVFLIKTDSAGNSLWCKYYGENGNSNDWASSLIEAPDNGYVLAGSCGTFYSDGYLLKTDTSGFISCNGYSYLLTNHNYVSSSTNPLASSLNLNFVTQSSNISIGFFPCATIDPCTVGIEETAMESLLNVYPNPSNGNFHINGIEQGSEIQVFGPLGQSVLEMKAKSENESIDLSQYSPGIYFYRITKSDGHSSEGRLIRQ